MIIVLGHAHADGTIDDDCRSRIARLANMDSNQTLLLAGGRKSSHPVSEARQMRDTLGSWTSPVILEEWSRTTAENAWCALGLIDDGESIQIVCSRAHSIRTWIFFSMARRDMGRRHRISFACSPTPSPRSWLYELRHLHHIARNRRQAQIRLAQMRAASV